MARTLVNSVTITQGTTSQVGDFKYSYLPEDQFIEIHGSGWARAKGQDIIGSKLHELIGATHLAEGRGPVIRGIVDVEDKQFLPTDVNVANDTIFIPDHGYNTGMKVEFSSTGGIVGGLSTRNFANKNLENVYNRWFVIKVDDNNIKIASTFNNAHSNIAVNLTSQGSGVHTLHQRIDPSDRYNINNGSVDNNAGSWQDESQRPQTITSYLGQGDGGGQLYYAFYSNQDGLVNQNPRTEVIGNESQRETRMANISAYLYVKINED